MLINKLGATVGVVDLTRMTISKGLSSYLLLVAAAFSLSFSSIVIFTINVFVTSYTRSYTSVYPRSLQL